MYTVFTYYTCRQAQYYKVGKVHVYVLKMYGDKKSTNIKDSRQTRRVWLRNPIPLAKPISFKHLDNTTAPCTALEQCGDNNNILSSEHTIPLKKITDC